MGPGTKVVGSAATDKLAAVARADRTGVEPGAHADVSELSEELLLGDLSERAGHRRGVSAGGSVATAVPATGALRDDHPGEHRRAALSGSAGPAGRRSAEVVS